MTVVGVAVGCAAAALLLAFCGFHYERIGLFFFWKVKALRRWKLVRKWRTERAGQALFLDATGATDVAPWDSRPVAPGATRVVAVSDTHGFMEDVLEMVPPGGQVLLHNGDVLLQSRLYQSSAAACRAAVTRFARALTRLPTSYVHVVVIGGNHDVALVTLGAAEVQAVLTDVMRRGRPGLTVTYLQDQGAVLPGVGLAVYGSPASVGSSRNAAFQPKTHRQVQDRVITGLRGFMAGGAEYVHPVSVGGLRQRPHVVMLHGPPRPDTKRAIQNEATPALVTYGHIHAAFGRVDTLGDTLFVNASSLDGGYAPVHLAVVFDVQVGAARG